MNDICLSPDFNSFGCITRSKIVGSYVNYTFDFLWNCRIIFHSGCITLHFHQQYTMVPISPVIIYIISILIVKWYVIVDLICTCIFLIISVVKHIFMCILDIRISFLEECLFKSFAHF